MNFWWGLSTWVWGICTVALLVMGGMLIDSPDPKISDLGAMALLSGIGTAFVAWYAWRWYDRF